VERGGQGCGLRGLAVGKRQRFNTEKRRIRGAERAAQKWAASWRVDLSQCALLSGPCSPSSVNIGGAGDQADWSPDGSQIAFSTSRDGDAEIYVTNVDGSGLTRLTTNPANDLSPSWSPDGMELGFPSDRSGYFKLYAMKTDGSSPCSAGNVCLLSVMTSGDKSPTWKQVPPPPTPTPTPTATLPAPACTVTVNNDVTIYAYSNPDSALQLGNTYAANGNSIDPATAAAIPGYLATYTNQVTYRPIQSLGVLFYYGDPSLNVVQVQPTYDPATSPQPITFWMFSGYGLTGSTGDCGQVPVLPAINSCAPG